MSTEKILLSEDEWKKRLSSDEFRVLRKKGTDPPGTGKYVHNKAAGVYVCAGCGNVLFSSETKFESGTGWPSFSAPVNLDAVEQKSDGSMGMKRVEIVCSKCGGHLGHVFTDGPAPTGCRYCMNSSALHFQKK